ncbi:MAG: hypothetical protein JNL60_02695, partial [Bacteroidia bacterium]|nr:hypothetical protein [Bacteroidia bacterium]
MKRLFITILFILGLFASFAAQEKGTGPKEKSFKQELKSNKQIRREAREKRRMEREE